jgi:alpha-N-arabinofuranosidase
MEDGALKLQLRPNVLSELTNPSLLARRIEHLQFTASTKLRFSTEHPNEKAGLILYRSSKCHYQLLKTEEGLVLIKTVKGEQTEVARVPFEGSEVVLKAKADQLDLQFFYGESESSLKPIGEMQNMNVLSWETAKGFTGPYIGMYATSSGKESTATASFDWFEYRGE